MATSRSNRHNRGGKNDLHAASFMNWVHPRSRELPKTEPHRSGPGNRPLPGRRRGRGRSRY